jgi:cell filamentation protein
MNKYDYEYEWDSKYCYPNSYTLKNKLNIKDSNLLMEAERKIVAVKLYDAKVSPINGYFDVVHYLDVHKYLFEDIYDWLERLGLSIFPRVLRFVRQSTLILTLKIFFQNSKTKPFLRD